MKKLYVVLAILLMCYPTLAQVKNEGIPYIRNYTQQDYSASPQNWAIVQDHRGVMYFGNNFGVVEFDGNHWRLISLANRTIARSLAVDKTGRIYVGGQGDFGYLETDERGQMAYVSLKSKIEEKHQNFADVWKIYTSDDGVYYCTVSGVYHLQNDKIKVYEAPVTPTGYPFLVYNKLLLPIPGKGVYELKNDRFVFVPGSEKMADYVIIAMLPHTNGRSLILTEENGIFMYNGYSGFEPVNWAVEDFLIKNKVYAATSLSEEYAIGTAHDGLLIIDKNGVPRQHLNREKGLQNSNVRSIYQDQSGNLWLALNNGIDYLETNSAFTLFNAKNGIPGTGYTSLLDGDVLYLGTNDGLYYKTWSNTENPLNPSPFRQVGNTQGQVYNLQKINDRLLLSHHNGPFEIINNTAYRLSEHRGAWLFVPLASRPGYVVCGTYSGLLLYKFVNGKLEYQHRINGFDESARVVEEDKEGNIWVAHGYKGVYKLRLSEQLDEVEKLSFYDQRAGFPSNLFINVFKISGKLVFTGERGIYKYNKSKDRFEEHEELGKLLGQETHIRKLIEDSEGNIWFSAGVEMGVLKKRSNGSYEIEKNVFNKLEGKLTGGFEHITHYNPLNVLIGVDDGFVHYHPNYQQARSLNKSFHTLIRRVEITAQGQDSLLSGGTFQQEGIATLNQSEEKVPVLAFDSNSVKFTFGAISYDDIDRVRYQCYLEGFEAAWSPWSTGLQKEYTNLREGTYTFHVRAKNIYGNVSEEATYTFVVSPPWYRSLWAYLIYACLFILALFLIKKLQDLRVAKTKQRLQEEQEKALKLKEAKHKEEVLLAEREIIRLNNEKLEDELVHKNKELTSSAVHVMQNMQAVHKVKDQLQETIEQVTCKNTLKQLKKLLKSVEEEIKFENNWEQFELHFNQVHQDFLTRLREEFPDLTHRDLKLCAYLRLNLTSKEIASLLKLSLRGVETSRYRIRKKIKLDQEDNLTEFMLNY
ncbi:two-component regulator propeller domain-containing protein [uncultured Pontibacter sp.]|uniref:ligand-binding sensor domain-containing protein n=1 Tax=uncultured Pontibacter sp. TaxID=453356 RepID=UPI002610807A|nr:two-component regulator propeller domain-containing protein [uncultured Pontibacter sp.]